MKRQMFFKFSTLFVGLVLVAKISCQSINAKIINYSELEDCIFINDFSCFTNKIDELSKEDLLYIKNDMNLIQLAFIGSSPSISKKLIKLYSSANIIDVRRRSLLNFLVRRMKTEEEIFHSKYTWEGKDSTIIDSVLLNFEILKENNLNLRITEDMGYILETVLYYPLSLSHLIEYDRDFVYAELIKGNNVMNSSFQNALKSFSNKKKEDYRFIKSVIKLLSIIDDSELINWYISLCKEAGNTYQIRFLTVTEQR